SGRPSTRISSGSSIASSSSICDRTSPRTFSIQVRATCGSIAIGTPHIFPQRQQFTRSSAAARVVLLLVVAILVPGLVLLVPLVGLVLRSRLRRVREAVRQRREVGLRRMCLDRLHGRALDRDAGDACL